MNGRPVRIGVIGCGTVAAYGHLPTIAASGAWELAGIAEADPARLASVAAEHRPPLATVDYRELLAAPGLEAVVVATHTDSHRDIACAALERGLDVLCEKPMASDETQCREMAAAAERSGRLLAINFNTRSAPILREIKRLIDAGTVGTVRVARFVYAWSAHQWQPLERFEAFMRNGGPIIDSGVHFFDGVRWYTGQEIDRVDAAGVVLPPYDAPQHVIATCRLSGGATALVEVGWMYCKRSKDRSTITTYDVIGDDGAISFDAETRQLRIYARDRSEAREFADLSKGFDFVYDRFARSVRERRLVDLASGVDGLRATEAAYRALAAATAEAGAAARRA
ncbi:MAG TPA: Gfo/Idh/MocA family oxidoreductase [Planctomycetota bacterium]|nr:Gfo/Idh/MocA family oxidoreductase [Planctomycetota bacterium]